MTDRDDDSPAHDERQSSWISLGFEELVNEFGARGGEPEPFDVLIVGSGYGGAVAAAELAGAREGDRAIRVCVLERGQEYLPGSFPSTADELPGHVRVSRPRAVRATGHLDGLYDVKLGPDVNAIVANGLGGGSLINAGVMLEPAAQVLNELSPGLGPFLAAARTLLGANSYPGVDALPAKGKALGALAAAGKAGHEPVPITLGLPKRVTNNLPPAPTHANVALENCVECGDCAAGCNFGAKNSLDVNLLVRAAHHGAQIYTGATVLWIERGAKNAGWIVHAVPTDSELRRRHGEPLKISARKLVLAAGTFGSTEILLRSQTPRLKFPPLLGRRFSTNGDMIAVVYDQRDEANAVANEEEIPSERRIGPTITSMIDLRGDPKAPFVIQEIATPGPLRRIFEELFTTAHVFDTLATSDTTTHTGRERGIDPCAVNPAAIRHSSVLAVMGDDGAEGEIELMGECCEAHGDGAVMVRWPRLRTGEKGKANQTLFDDQIAYLEGLAGQKEVHGSVLPNPVWRLLPQKLSFLLDEARGPTLTVHPLGGCPLGDDRTRGVVNAYGQVFDGLADFDTGVFGDLVVLDGSIVGVALGVNPALTITALALRAARELRSSRKWNYSAPPQGPLPSRRRPVFQARKYGPSADTTLCVLERLVGEVAVQLPQETSASPKMVELTLRYRPTALLPLMSSIRRKLVVDSGQSMLRLFEPAAYRKALEPALEQSDVESRLAKACLSKARLEGTLRFFHREPSTVRQRRCRALWGYFWNRGLRDICQFFVQWWRERGRKEGSKDSLFERAKAAWALATHAGEARVFSYNLRALDWSDCVDAKAPGGGAANSTRAPLAIQGRKRLTYGHLANLWHQLETLELRKFGGRVDGRLEVDLNFFHKESAALARIDTQANLVRSIIELGAFAGYLVRLMTLVHVWTFRRPDSPAPRQPQRLPREIERSWLSRILRCAPPRPRIQELTVATLANGTPVNVRLTRYARFNSKGWYSAEPRSGPLRFPVLLIHGYSASGTTFAHTAVRPCLAEVLWKGGRDVWVVDLRTSSGMATATLPWSFDDAALVDIPAAIDHVLRETGAEKLDVVAHCMGAAMFSMAVLKRPEPGEPLFDVRLNLPKSIRSAVLSQVGPLVQFTSINVLRADVMRHTRRYLGAQTYDFRVKDSPSLAEQLQDRLLSSLRYPEEELRIENPMFGCWRPNEYVGTRHRMDALYGRAFSLANIDRKVLDRIDDFFGPLSLETVSQGMHLAEQNVVTDRAGRNVYLTPETRDTRWVFPTLTLHGSENGMVDPLTRIRVENYFNFDDATGEPVDPPRVKTRAFPGLGHQDSLIGSREKTAPVFDAIVTFLDGDAAPNVRDPVFAWLLRPPWIGPIRGPGIPGPGGGYMMAAATGRKLGDAVFVVCVAVDKVGDRYRPVKIDTGHGGQSSAYLMQAECDRDGWLSFRVPGKLAGSPADGFLVLLAYNQSLAMQSPDWNTALDLLGKINRRGFPVAADLGKLVAEEQDLELKQEEKLLLALGDSGTDAQASGVILDWLRSLVELFRKQLRFDGLPEGMVEADLAKPEHDATYFDPAFVRTKPLPGPNVERAQIFFGSCQYPSGLMDLTPAWRSYKRLGEVLDRADAAPDAHRVLLLVGDQIYSDSTAGLADPETSDDRYRRPHEDLFSRPEVKAALRKIPTVMMLDDHEIADNWEPSVDDRRPREFLKAPLDAYKDFQRRAGPPFEAPFADSIDPLWFKHSLGAVRMFVADSRSERRARRAADVAASRIMSEGQMEKLRAWLTDLHRDPVTAEAPKFVASPAMLLPRRLGVDSTSVANAGPLRRSQAASIRFDNWDGYPDTRAALLHFIASRGIRNVVFLSGDEHLFCRARIEVFAPGAETAHVLHSIHSSPLYAPYPFANAHPEEFALAETFSFAAPDATLWQCRVEATIYPGKCGFAELDAKRPVGRDWEVNVRFFDAESSGIPGWTKLF